MRNFKDIFNILPNTIKNTLIEEEKKDYIEEIRVRAEKPIILQIRNREKILNYTVTKEDIKIILQRMSNYSIYAFEEEIKQGYITIKGGHRVGICGRCIIEKNKVKTIKDIASLNIRICREVQNCSDFIMPFIINKNIVMNTIIISPPKCGKTTLIRDITKNLSNGFKDLQGKKICVVDERSEIAACFDGVPQLNVGIRTDILDNCPKSEGIIMAIRSMAPEIIVCDEIGTEKDMESIIMALNSGVSVITTIHGYGVEDLYNRKVFEKIVENKVFKRAIVLSNKKSVGTLEYVYDFENKIAIWRR
ncbi:hypothetical protein CLOACE_01910 [Clostridium acetireducens DSM 10703]|uniref:Stage III sporulation protein AA AAA+ ATPase domain-containing protein n=1 Tax=Clostridium acetireducens DSM 10703 TaxID=1121290 RepID=A0A1E8F1R1_9CLOT|nr:stage III sporulation protein AA [Clostridium acetireducens]OFI07587.1 hypothetical protein CLOACE_01910 [Clostridium acetireducens DSM 10703]